MKSESNPIPNFCIQIRSEIIQQKSTINYPFQLRQMFPDFLMFLEETRTLALTTRKNSQLVFACWQTWAWLLTDLNIVDDSLEHGCWQPWTWLLTALNMVVDRLEHGCWQPWTLLLTGLNIVVDRLEHCCWHAWIWLLTGLNIVVDSLEHGCWQAWTWNHVVSIYSRLKTIATRTTDWNQGWMWEITENTKKWLEPSMTMLVIFLCQ